MFRAELGKPVHREDGFTQFIDEDVTQAISAYKREYGKESKFAALHTIPVGLAPSDKDLIQRVHNGEVSPSEVAGERYWGRILYARLLGCTTTRLQIVKGNERSEPLDSYFFWWQRAITESVNTKAGEGVRTVWLDHQKDMLETALSIGDGPELLQSFNEGVENDYPVGGNWTIFADRRPIVTAEIMYSKEGGQVDLRGFDVYHRPDLLSAGTQAYITFWDNVANNESMILHPTLPPL